MMFKAAVILFASGLAGPAAASCVGSSSFQSCTDLQSGNSYTIMRSGNTTMMQGNNYRTGSTWSQQSQDFGSTSFNSGIDSQGKPWNSTCVNGICN